jgi:hypothetical protein
LIVLGVLFFAFERISVWKTDCFAYSFGENAVNLEQYLLLLEISRSVHNSAITLDDSGESLGIVRVVVGQQMKSLDVDAGILFVILQQGKYVDAWELRAAVEER